jgi:predicted phage tail protein
MSQPSRSKGRVAFGVFAMFLGATSIIGFSSMSFYFGLGFFGPAGFGAVMIAIGLSLILKKDTVTE